MAIIVSMNPLNITGVGVSEYIINPNISAAKGSAPDIKMEDTPESMYFRLSVDRMYGRANENVECMIKKSIVNFGFIDMKLLIWLKLVNGIRAIEMNITE